MRAKFNVYSKMIFTGGSTAVKLQAVTDDGNPENKAFWSATPNGTIEISISNPDAVDYLAVGKAYYVDFSEAA